MLIVSNEAVFDSKEFFQPKPKPEPKPSQVMSKAWAKVFYIVTMCPPPHACPIPPHACSKFNVSTSTEHNHTKFSGKAQDNERMRFGVKIPPPLLAQTLIFDIQGGTPQIS